MLVGGRGGQLDFLDTAGYGKQGLPSNMLPALLNPGGATNDFIDTTLGLAFHSDSGFLRGILEKTSPATQALINGSVIAARSENDTGNNPHNLEEHAPDSEHFAQNLASSSRPASLSA